MVCLHEIKSKFKANFGQVVKKKNLQTWTEWKNWGLGEKAINIYTQEVSATG